MCDEGKVAYTSYLGSGCCEIDRIYTHDIYEYCCREPLCGGECCGELRECNNGECVDKEGYSASSGSQSICFQLIQYQEELLKTKSSELEKLDSILRIEKGKIFFQSRKDREIEIAEALAGENKAMGKQN
ncbi:MAG: hypothetical protein ACOX3T_04205 [Bdellovibrionota bacterium]